MNLFLLSSVKFSLECTVGIEVISVPISTERNTFVDRINSEVPEFIRDEFPKFIDFIKTYYSQPEHNSSLHLERYKDLDQTSGEFLELLRKEYSDSSRLFDFLSDKEFLRNSKEIFAKKGTIESIKFLFYALCGEEIEIENLNDRIFKPSDSKWEKRYSIKVSITDDSSTAESLVGEFVTIRNESGDEQQIEIEDILDITDKIANIEASKYYELFFLTELTINTQIGNYAYSDSVGFKQFIVPSLSQIEIIDAGTKFKVGQLIRLDSNIGSGAVAIVSRVTAVGGIRNIKIIKFGNDYRSNFFIGVIPSDMFQSNLQEAITTSVGYDYIKSIRDVQDSYTEYGNIITGQYALDTTTTYAKYGYNGVVNSEFTFKQSFYSEEYDSALILCKMGTICSYSGRYLQDSGQPSNRYVVRDQNIYQPFSYSIKSQVDIKDFYPKLETSFHPAGYKVFSDRYIPITLTVSEPSIISTLTLDDLYSQGLLRSSINIGMTEDAGQLSLIYHISSNSSVTTLDVKAQLEVI